MQSVRIITLSKCSAMNIDDYILYYITYKRSLTFPLHHLQLGSRAPVW